MGLVLERPKYNRTMHTPIRCMVVSSDFMQVDITISTCSESRVLDFLQTCWDVMFLRYFVSLGKVLRLVL